MRVILTGLAIVSIVVPTILFAQSNPQGAQAIPVSTRQPSSANERKVHYVEKRTRPVQNYSKDKSKTYSQKKPLVRKTENQKKVSK